MGVVPRRCDIVVIDSKVLHKRFIQTEDKVEFIESEEYDVKNCDINAAYKRIEEEVIDGIA